MQFPPSTAPAGPSPGSAWERVVRLAVAALRVPAAVLVQAGSARVLAAHGIDLETAAGGEAFYVRALGAAGPSLAVGNSSQDALFAGEPLVAGASPMCAGLAAALEGAPGRPRAGVLCVFDSRPREFTPDEGAALADLAALALGELDRPREEDDDRYRSIFENAVEGIYQSLPEGGFLSVNPALARLLGYATPAAMIAAVRDPSRLYVLPGRRDEFEARLHADGLLADWESEVYRADGTRLWISEHARAICGADGGTVRYEGTFEDITARKDAEAALQRARDELEDRVRERTMELALLNGTLRQHIHERDIAESAVRRSESKFRALIENAQDLISVLTPDGISLYQSPSVEHILGRKPDEMIGRNVFQETVHPDDRAAVERAAWAITEGGERYMRVEVRCRHRDGSWRLLESVGSATPPDSPVVGLVVNSRDITGRRHVEMEHRARTREQTAVAELGRYALDDRSLHDIFERTVTLVAHALQVPYCNVNELLPGPGAPLLVRAAVGWSEGTAGHARVLDWRQGPPESTDPSSAPELIIVDDLATYSADLLTLRPPDGQPEPRSVVSVVLYCDGRRYGSLSALSPVAGRFDRQDALFLQTVADLLSAVIESEQHKAASREVQARYERIAANTPGMVYQAVRRVDGTGSILFVSEGCRQLYGLEPAQILAQPELMNEMIHPEDRARTRPLLAASNAEITPLEWEGRIVHPDGEVRWVTARSRPERLPNGDIHRDGVVFDVTELKRAQEEMRAAKEEAENANRAKSEFLSRISHELRTPLNAILGFGQLLGLEQLPPVQASSVDQILKGGRHLLDLINEVLDITRIESGGMELSLAPVDVATTLREALNFVRPLAEQYRVRFVPPELEGCPAVVADRGRLHQVLLNLLSNAVKYNREGGEVRVRCAPGGDAGTVRLSIADTGPGMTAAEIGQLFTPFQRLGAAQRGIAGTGIGLTISRSLVEAMGGTIGVESTPGAGSVFHVDLPAAPADAPLPATSCLDEGLPEAPETARQPALRQVLLIDDQSANVALIERVLEARDNLRLLTAADGLSGLAVARQNPLDLILLDLHLPDIGGDEVMRRLRLEPRLRDVPVVVLSADATRTQIDRLKALGAREYLTKPFRIRELLGAVDAALAAPAAAST